MENLNKLSSYAALVAEWGKKMNLVSEPETGAVMTQHVNDCVRAYECLKENLGEQALSGLPLVDIGSGAGFPGIVWAILNPAEKVFLIEPREKRVTFLKHVAFKLGLKNVEVICSRFEDLAPNKLPERCLFTSRALGYDADLTDTMLKQVTAKDSVWAVMSGPESLEKLRNSVRRATLESSQHSSPIVNDYSYELAGELGVRHLLVCSKP